MALHGLLGKARQHVQLGQDAAVALDVRNGLLDAADEFPVQARFQRVDAVLGREDLFLVGLEFLGDVTFGVHQGLLADPLRRHLVLVGIAHLDIIAENVVVGNFEGGNPGAFGFPLLHLEEVILSSGGKRAELVQFGIHAGADDRSLADLNGRFRIHHPLDFGEQFLAVAEAPEQFFQGFGTGQALLDGPDERQAPAQLHYLARIGFSGGHTAQDAFHIPQLTQIHLGFLQDFRGLGEVLHNIVAGVQLLQVHDGHRQPLTQHTCAHGTGTFVQGLHQRHAIGPGCALEDLQVAQGELVHPHKAGLVNAADGADVLETGVLRLFQVHQQSAGAADAQGIRVDGKALEAVHAQLPLEALYGGIVHKSPLVDGGGENVPQTLLEAFFVAALHHQLPGFHRPHQGGDILQRALRHLELSCGYIQERGAAQILFNGEAAEVVVLLDLQHILPKGDTRRNNLCHTALHQFFSKFGVLQLVAHGHFEASAHQFGEIIFQGVMGETGHGHRAFVSVGLFGLYQAQHPHGRDGIVGIAFIEVSHAVQQQSFGVLCLHLEVMLEHRGIFRYLGHLVICELQKYEKNGNSCAWR